MGENALMGAKMGNRWGFTFVNLLKMEHELMPKDPMN